MHGNTKLKYAEINMWKPSTLFLNLVVWSLVSVSASKRIIISNATTKTYC